MWTGVPRRGWGGEADSGPAMRTVDARHSVWGDGRSWRRGHLEGPRDSDKMAPAKAFVGLGRQTSRRL